MTSVTDSWVLWRFRNRHEDLGKFGERLWSRIMCDCGLMYVPLKDLPAINGKGPRMRGAGSDVILPDFDVTSGRRRAYMDSKCKTGPVLYEKANEWRQGIDRKDLVDYESMSAINRQKCFIALVEIFTDEKNPGEWSGTLLMQTLGELGSPIRGVSTQSHMVYWPRRKFVQVGTMEPKQIWDVSNGLEQTPESIRHEVGRLFARKESTAIQGRLFV